MTQKMIKTEKINRLIREFENTEYFGYMFFIEYNGEKFDSFDENSGKKSVKSEFRKLLEKNNIKIFKGIQQAGRTDKEVNAEENILYVNSKQHIMYEDIINECDGLKIKRISKTLPFLEFPQMIEKRYYIYEYPEHLIKNNEEKIKKNCEELSGKRNYIKFTSKKGKQLKNHIREIYVKFESGKLYFEGNGFLHQQVRIMSNFILNGSMRPLQGKYLIFKKADLSVKLKKLIFNNVDRKIFETEEDLKNYSIGIKEERILNIIENIEKNSYFYIFYVKEKNKSELIGKKGKNIKKLKKIFGNIVVKGKD
ncbi:pseudouridylate synthase [Leptotrichia sp. OH3620_COT-345]|uniref:pseudouridylate synthase n=1 Tax=Leptotrichia sp. OH3620_COT-345 TaxID=2491048 RepID=UPI001F3CD1F4|nr:pseudouridylate synthase [Leptotrichia sp. OH3620_COT-345]